MKKFLSLCLVAVMLVASVSVVASAAAADWVAGNGFDIVENDEAGQKVTTTENSPVTVKDAADGVAVSHGGYYTNGQHWGGVASAAQYNVDGLEVTVRFDQVPEVSAADDCWMTVDFLSKPQLFQVGAVADNPGFMCLVRFGKPYIEIYEGVGGFTQVGNSQAYDHNEIFAVKSGDTIKFKIAYDTENAQYKVTYTNGETSYEVPETATVQLTDTFFANGGKANVAIAASLFGSQQDAFKYTILSVTDGAPLTDEVKAAYEQHKADEEAKKQAEKEEREKQREEEKKKKEEEKKKAEEEAAKEDTAAEDKTADTAEVAETSSSNVGIIVAIVIIVIVVIAIVAVVIVKKKGSKK